MFKGIFRLSLVGVFLISSVFSAQAECEKIKIRVMAANISSGTRQSYDNGEGLRIFQGLKPDVVLIQEFNYGTNSAEDLKKFVKEGFGETFTYYREAEARDDIPNGIISRYPITESGEWEDVEMPNRDFAWAKIDIPGEKNLWAISVHLSAKKANVRAKESKTLVDQIRAHIPEADYVVLGGDFNTQKRTDEPLGILAEVVSEKLPPQDSEGFSTTNMNRTKSYDWVLADPDLLPLMVPVTFLAKADEVAVANENSFATGLVFNSVKFPHLDRVAPIQQNDSVAPGMQHLAVVKDFEITVSE